MKLNMEQKQKFYKLIRDAVCLYNIFKYKI